MGGGGYSRCRLVANGGGIRGRRRDGRRRAFAWPIVLEEPVPGGVDRVRVSQVLLVQLVDKPLVGTKLGCCRLGLGCRCLVGRRLVGSCFGGLLWLGGHSCLIPLDTLRHLTFATFALDTDVRASQGRPVVPASPAGAESDAQGAQPVAARSAQPFE